MINRGDPIRLIDDPGRTGTFTGDRKDRGDREYLQIRFPDRTAWIPVDQLEVIADSEPPISLLEKGRIGRPSDLRRTLVHFRLSGKLANFIYSLGATGTVFYPYQFKPLLKLLNSNSNGILIADEVGLGKTIEAGLIWTELRTRLDYRRLLVLCPAMLREKWQRELRTRFGVRADICDARETLARLMKAARGEEPEYCIIASLQGLRPPRDWEVAADGSAAALAAFLQHGAEDEPLVDVLVIDEAHYLKNPETMTAVLGSLARKVSSFVVLLSATPVHLRSDDLFYLLKLVDGDTYSHSQIFQDIVQANRPLLAARQRVQRGQITSDELRSLLSTASRHSLLAENRQLQGLIQTVPSDEELAKHSCRVELAHELESVNLIGQAVTRTRKREVHENTVKREPRTLVVEMTGEERYVYDEVEDVVRRHCAVADKHEGFLLVTPQRQMASSMVAALTSWSGLPEEYLLDEDNYWLVDDADFGRPRRSKPSGPVVHEIQSKVDFSWVPWIRRNDSKYEMLRSALLSFLKDNPREKVVLFSSFVRTLEYLSRRLSEDGVTVELLHGRIKDKDDVIRRFREDPSIQILLSSEVGSEGIDLQFCWIMVNYDLPWNPMKIEQRIGRLDRIGQTRKKIQIWNLIHADTIDQRIYDRLLARLGVFEHTVGELEPIMGPLVKELTYDLLREDLTKEQEEEMIDQALLAVEHKRKEVENLEREAASLVVYGDYILDQVQAAQDLGRHITEDDVRWQVMDFFGLRYPGCRFVQSEHEPTQFDIELSAAAKNDFEEFLRQRQTAGRSRLTSSTPTAIRCRFDHRSHLDLPGIEVINQFHPLVKFVTEEVDRHGLLQRPAIASLVRDHASLGLPAGDYVFLVVRWVFKAIRPVEQLWYGALAVDDPSRDVSQENAERLLGAVAESGLDWLSAQNDIDLTQATELIDSRLLTRSNRAFDAFKAKRRAENADRADLQEQTIRTHLEQERQKYVTLRDKYRAMGIAGFVKAQDNNIQKLEARTERELEKVNKGRSINFQFDELSVGIVRLA